MFVDSSEKSLSPSSREGGVIQLSVVFHCYVELGNLDKSITYLQYGLNGLVLYMIKIISKTYVQYIGYVCMDGLMDRWKIFINWWLDLFSWFLEKVIDHSYDIN